MRDNHTFLPLPLDNTEALSLVLKEFDAGSTHGMLCAKDTSKVVHAGGAETREAFRIKAVMWLSESSNQGVY